MRRGSAQGEGSGEQDADSEVQRMVHAHGGMQDAQSGSRVQPARRGSGCPHGGEQDAQSGVRCSLCTGESCTARGSLPVPPRSAADAQRLALSCGSFKTGAGGGARRGGRGARAAPGQRRRGRGLDPSPAVPRPMSRPPPPPPPPGSPRRFGALSTAQLRTLLQDESRLQRAARLTRKVRPGRGYRGPAAGGTEPSRARSPRPFPVRRREPPAVRTGCSCRPLLAGLAAVPAVPPAEPGGRLEVKRTPPGAVRRPRRSVGLWRSGWRLPLARRASGGPHLLGSLT